MNWDDLRIAFWHPFGPYCGLTVDEVLRWKGDEARAYGWTFWSFAYSPSATRWGQVLEEHNGSVHVLCSYSPKATDPEPTTVPRRATHYRFLGASEWQSMPSGDQDMFVTNPFKRGGLASAFKVDSVEPMPATVPPVTVEWYSRRDDRWRGDPPLPTRGEFLLRRGGPVKLRPICAVLKLSPPYLAELRNDALAGAV
jgi:hypothetical protein